MSGENRDHFDCLIIGAGFSGSLLALVLARSGRNVLLVDRDAHPRFAVGESSTPIADMLLERLAQRFHLPELKPLARYGSWLRERSQLGCGLKRGFTYFAHQPDGSMRQMLVTASASDEVGDTHWLRADVDHHLVQLAQQRGVTYRERTKITRLLESEGVWRAELESDANRGDLLTSSVTADFVVDASGRGGVLHKCLGLQDRTSSLNTFTVARFAHLSNVARLTESLAQSGMQCNQHPFMCDDAAVHHLLDDGWLWMLRFRDGCVSTGRVWYGQEADENLKRLDRRDPFDVERFAFLKSLLVEARIVNQVADEPRQRQDAAFSVRETSGRMQHRVGPVAGKNWALLPSAAVTLDPLHSSGIAHGIAAVTRLASILSSDRDWASDLASYADTLESEIEFMDLLVDGAYRAMPHFDLFASFCLLYFVGAIAFEESLAATKIRDGESDRESDAQILRPLWLAGDTDYVNLVRRYYQRIAELTKNATQTTSGARPVGKSGFRRVPTEKEIVQFEADLRRDLRPWKQVHLFDPDCNRMYRYTDAPKS